MAAAAAATCLLLDLSHDEVSIVTHELCDPLQPLLAVHVSSTAKGLRKADGLDFEIPPNGYLVPCPSLSPLR